jgi:hypothetical protein
VPQAENRTTLQTACGLGWVNLAVTLPPVVQWLPLISAMISWRIRVQVADRFRSYRFTSTKLPALRFHALLTIGASEVELALG